MSGIVLYRTKTRTRNNSRWSIDIPPVKEFQGGRAWERDGSNEPHIRRMISRCIRNFFHDHSFLVEKDEGASLWLQGHRSVSPFCQDTREICERGRSAVVPESSSDGNVVRAFTSFISFLATALNTADRDFDRVYSRMAKEAWNTRACRHRMCTRGSVCFLFGFKNRIQGGPGEPSPG
jgi:hypothetical protein